MKYIYILYVIYAESDGYSTFSLNSLWSTRQHAINSVFDKSTIAHERTRLTYEKNHLFQESRDPRYLIERMPILA